MTITSSSPRSSFYHDGYRARLDGGQCSPPDVPVYAAEYRQGYYDAAFDPRAAKRIARNIARRERDQVRRDCGLTRGRDSLGRVIWE